MSKTTPIKVSITIPVYNEEFYLPQVIALVENAPLPAGVTSEIIIVNDGSTDKTKEILTALDPQRFTVHHCDKNCGKGAALRKAFSLTTGDIIIVQDADLECLPSEYPKLLEKILSGEASIVYGSRFLGGPHEMKLLYRLGNALLTILNWCLYRVWLTDIGTVYKVFHREVLDDINLTGDGFEFCVDFTAQALSAGYTIHEVPIGYTPRTIAEGKKIRVLDAFVIYWTLVRTSLKNKS